MGYTNQFSEGAAILQIDVLEAASADSVATYVSAAGYARFVLLAVVDTITSSDSLKIGLKKATAVDGTDAVLITGKQSAVIGDTDAPYNLAIELRAEELGAGFDFIGVDIDVTVAGGALDSNISYVLLGYEPRFSGPRGYDEVVD